MITRWWVHRGWQIIISVDPGEEARSIGKYLIAYCDEEENGGNCVKSRIKQVKKEPNFSSK
jgi:hypothetical protein